jgi:hypothetical protein
MTVDHASPRFRFSSERDSRAQVHTSDTHFMTH